MCASPSMSCGTASIMSSAFAIIEPDDRDDGHDLETVPCNLCESTDLETIYVARADLEKDPELAVKFRASSDELLTQPLVRCRRCSLLFVNPRIPAAAILAGYADGEDPQYVSQMAARVRTFARALRHIDRLKPARGRLLDLGTAAGAFLRAARDDGWDAIGVEPNRWLARWGRDNYGVPIEVGSIDNISAPEASFDVVTLWDVIEHTPDPLHVLRRARLLLKSDGVLVVNFPDIGSWIARAMGRSWPFLSSVHLYYFTRQTMRATLQKAGFEATTRASAHPAPGTRLPRIASCGRQPLAVQGGRRPRPPAGAGCARSAVLDGTDLDRGRALPPLVSGPASWGRWSGYS